MFHMASTFHMHFTHLSHTFHTFASGSDDIGINVTPTAHACPWCTDFKKCFHFFIFLFKLIGAAKTNLLKL